jgi:OOP family OmpA-OmpF porin
LFDEERGKANFIQTKQGENIMKKSVIFTTVLLLLTIVAAAQAEVKAGSFSVTPFVGGYLFEGNQDLKHEPVYGLRGGYNFTKNWGVEGVFDFVTTEYQAQAGNPNVKIYGFGIEGLYHFMPGSRLVPFLAIGTGGKRFNGSEGLKDRDRLFVDYGAGLKYFLTDNLAIRADVRHVILPLHDQYNNLLYTVGLNFAFGGEKKAAPVVMAERAAEPAAAPALEVKRDSDGDGVFDDMDMCPGTPAGVTVDLVGCPLDTDRDDVFDYLDKCPNTPQGVTVDLVGCPLDSDQDGVPDYLDKCPGTPRGVTVDKNGCPPPPTTPPPPPPPKPQVQVQKVAPQAASTMEKAIVEKGRVKLNVEFDTNKAVVKPKYNQEIKDLADILQKYPDLKITIEGHTDNVGGANANEKLSQKRADAIKNILMLPYGISASRLTAKGYGLTRPVATNATKEGRQKNRRVEAAAEYIIKK